MTEANDNGGAICRNCRFWMDFHDGSDTGECCRFPPAIIVLPLLCSFEACEGEEKLAAQTKFPGTDSDEWCGEFQARDIHPPLPDVPVKAAGFSFRVRRALAHGWTDYGDSRKLYPLNSSNELAERSADELLELRNFGVTSLNEVRDFLKKHGRHLRGEELTQ
jgi:Bacterial RNA polymerase, alpha chain C terminal domain